jgi:hypothetical protein
MILEVKQFPESQKVMSNPKWFFIMGDPIGNAAYARILDESEYILVEKTTADEYNNEEDVQLGYSIVKSNDEIEGVFIQEGKIVDIDYFDNHKKTTADSYNEDCPICGTNNKE